MTVLGSGSGVADKGPSDVIGVLSRGTKVRPGEGQEGERRSVSGLSRLD